jgi:serine/threonine protein kinase
MEPSPSEIWLLRKLSNKGLLSSAQVKQIFLNFEAAAKTKNPLSIEEILAQSGYLDIEVLNNFLNRESVRKTIGSNLKKPDFKIEELTTPFRVEELFENIDNLEYQKLLGQGHIGTSYLGEIDDFDLCVIKILKPKLLENEAYLNSVKKTLNLIDFKQHKNLVPQEFRQTNKGQVYFLSKFISHDSIGDIVSKSGRLEISSALDIILKTSEVLKFFERIKSPHLGLHPENIFIDNDGTIELKDFEWNRKFFNTMEDRIAIGPGLSYMAPEYINGMAVDQTADIYSLGVTLYFILTRKTPFHGSVESQLAKKIKLDYVPLEEIHRDIPLIVGALVKKMLEPDKVNRFQSYDELISNLNELLKKRQFNENLLKTSAIESPSNNAIRVKTKAKTERAKTFIDPIEIEPKQIEIKQKNNRFLVPILVLGAIVIAFLYFTAQQKVDVVIDDGQKTTVKSDIKIDKPLTIKSLDNSQIEPIEQASKVIKINEVLDRINLNKFKKIDPVKDEKKFSKRLNTIKVIQENLIDDLQLSKEVINEAIGIEIEKINNERQVYWEEKLPQLKKSFLEKDEVKAQTIIETVKAETDNDEVLQNKIFNLRVEIQHLEPESSKSFTLDNESQLLKESTEKKGRTLLESHEYTDLVKLYTEAFQKEKNTNQRQVYKDQIDFFEHAEKVKNFSQNISIKSNILLRSLFLDEDGILEAVSSKGFHVKGSSNTIIPWQKISAKTLAALVAKYDPNSLGECISLLIYASRAGNHIAMQKSLRTIEQKYFNYMNTPLVKENIEKLKELKGILSEEAIKLQISLINILKSRNNVKSKREAEILINELRDEYLTNPIYKKYEVEINDISVVLEQIK